MTTRFETPQTEDGRVTSVATLAPRRFQLTVEFDVSHRFIERVAGRFEHVFFATRSRLARLGINIKPFGPISFLGTRAVLAVVADSVVKSYGLDEHLEKLLLPGLRVGRLVFRDPLRRLSAEAVFDALTKNEFQLPGPLSIDKSGRITVRPHRCVYDLHQPVSLQDLIAIVAREDGKSVLNRLQVRRNVEHIVLAPGDAVITSCSMFLHEHFVVLDTEENALGQHLWSTFLDPVITRGSQIFLEFANLSDTTIVNPSVAATIYSADEVMVKPRTIGWTAPRSAPDDVSAENHTRLLRVYQAFDREEPLSSYLYRPFAVAYDLDETCARGAPDVLSAAPKERAPYALDQAAARQPGGPEVKEAIPILAPLGDLADGAGATVLLRFFPNMQEHLALCSAAIRGKIRQVVFRRASFEHGPFLSARDHGRLADYEALGLEVLWCNDMLGHVARHVYRGYRGFFVPLEKIEDFESSLVIAVYGSTQPLSESESEGLRALLSGLHGFFGGQVAFLTGGGPGAMTQAAGIARSLGALVGGNFLETVDQSINTNVDYYQTFQDGARHYRQRWFEIAGFHVFCAGGVGTLEEIGMTLTDVKLGVVERGPLVFFGDRGLQPYWQNLGDQLHAMAIDGRGPEWLKTDLLMTSNAAEVVSFFRRFLELG